MGQVGQESNLQPAVLEPAALRSAAFRDVHDDTRNRPFRWSKVRGSSPAFTRVGVKIGVKSTRRSYSSWARSGEQVSMIGYVC
jgi:hypothetical protein